MNMARPFRKARKTNSNSSGFPTWVSSEFDPSFVDPDTAAGRVIIPLSNTIPGGPHGSGGQVPCSLVICPYGLGNDDDAFSIRIVGMRRLASPGSDGRMQWFRFPIATLGCVVSTAVGLASGQVLATERFADAITIALEGTITAATTREGNIVLYSPGSNVPAHAIVPIGGWDAIELEWDQTTGTPTMNALLSFLD